MEPMASLTGSPAPMAAAMGSSIRLTNFAPASMATSWTLRRSTSVTPEGMQTTTRALAKKEAPIAFWMNLRSISVVMSKSAITPSRSGRMAVMEPGVRPIISLAWLPTATTFAGLVLTLTATTDGSRITMPLPLTNTRVLAVPRSMAISWENSIAMPP